MKPSVRISLLAAVLLLVAGTSFAQDVTEKSGPGQINWSKQEVLFTGDGAPNLKAPNAAAARLGAERAAKLMALRNALEVLKGVKIKAGQTVGDKFTANPKLMSEVEGVVKNFSVVDIRYYSDGGVQVDVKVPLKGIIAQTLLKDEIKATPKPAAPVVKPEPKQAKAEPAKQPAKASVTGLVVDARGHKLIPVLAPKILDEQGNDVYNVAMVSDKGMDNGIASYIRDNEAAQKDQKVASTPITVKAIRSVDNVDLVISNKDAERIRAQQNPLTEGRVVIVKD